MKFGVDIPTCLVGMAYPIPFATGNDVVRIAVEAEQLGYHEVTGNDHLRTQRFVRKAWPVLRGADDAGEDRRQDSCGAACYRQSRVADA